MACCFIADASPAAVQDATDGLKSRTAPVSSQLPRVSAPQLRSRREREAARPRGQVTWTLTVTPGMAPVSNILQLEIGLCFSAQFAGQN